MPARATNRQGRETYRWRPAIEGASHVHPIVGRIAKHHSRTTVRVNEVCAHAADTRFSHVIERSVSNIRADYYNSAEMGAVAVQRIEQRTVVERIYARLHEHCARQSQHPRELSIAHKIANSRCVLAVGRERIRDGSP